MENKFWEKNKDELLSQSKSMDTEMEKAANRLTDILSNVQMETYLDAEKEMCLRDAALKEFFYKAGFKDAMQTLKN